MSKITIEDVDKDKVSDGYHTFEELYHHRHMLCLLVTKLRKDICWFSHLHSDGTMFDGFIIWGCMLPLGNVTYHLPETYSSVLSDMDCLELANAPEWDGKPASETITRITDFILR